MRREEFRAALPELVEAYCPAAAALKKINSICVLIIVGPSGSGKTTLINRIAIPYVPSDTTREAREGEKEGEDFYFRNDLEKVVEEIKKGEFVQVAVDSGGDLKATRASSYPDSGWVVMAVVADAVPLFRSLGFKKTLSAFIVPPSFQEWQRRMSTHHLSDEQLRKRLLEAERSFSFALNDNQTHLVLNDDIEEALKQLEDLVEGKTDVRREERAKAAAARLLSKVKLVNS